MSTNIEAIKAKVVGGILTAPTMQDMNETVRRLTEKTFNTINKSFTTDTARDKSEVIFSDLKQDIANIIAKGNYTTDAILTELMAESGESFAALGDDVQKKVTDISAQISQDLLSELNKNKTQSTTTTASSTSDTTSYGNISVLGQTGVNPNFSRGPVSGASREPIKIDQNVKVDVDLLNVPPSITPAQIDKIIQEAIKNIKMVLNEQAFKNYMADPSKVYE